MSSEENPHIGIFFMANYNESFLRATVKIFSSSKKSNKNIRKIA